MSDERRAQFEKEAERERRALELEEQARRDAAIERRWDLQRQGVEPHSVDQVLANASFGLDRADAAERRREREAAEVLGKPVEPRFDKWESKANVAAAEARRETTAATQADLRELQAEVTGLKSALHAVKRKLRR